MPTPGAETSWATLALDGLFLVSPWKPILLMIPFVAWAWVITNIYDKHAARFFLPRTTWNLVHLIAGLVALGAALAMPIRGEGAFWAGLGAMVVILSGDLLAYALVANRDERVPAEFHIKFNMAKLKENREAKAAAKKAGKVELVVKGPDKTTVPVPDNDTPEFAVRVVAEALVLKALEARSVQADLAPGAKDGGYGLSFLVDGVRQPGEVIAAADAIKAIDFWKSCAKLDVTDRRRRLVGDVNIERGVDRHKLRVIAAGAPGGMRLTLLTDPEKQVRRKAADLGLLEPQMAELKALVEQNQGVVLLGAPPDMGRTSTLYAVLKMHDPYTSNVQTVEMETQDSLEGIRQNVFEANKGDGPDYSTLVRSVLRRDPQVLGVADMPDDQTAKEVAKSEAERVRVYLSMRADSGLGAIQAYCKAVGDPELASRGLRGVLAQKLVRKLCTNCRQAYQPSPDMLKKLGLPADKIKQLFKKGGQVLVKGNRPETCGACRGVGYVGQEGLFEVFRLGDAERAAIKANNFAGLRAEMRKKSLPTLQQAALKKAVDGTTSVEEVLRVTAEAKPEAKSAPKPPSPPAAGPKDGSKSPPVSVG